MKRLITCIAAAAALALPATAGAGIKTYGGKIDRGGKIGIDADLAGGDPTEVTELRFKKFPANCSVTGASILSGPISFTNFLVSNNRFLFDGPVDKDGSEIYLKGRFKNDARKIAGEIKLKIVFASGPAQTCTTKRREYSAERGAPPPKAPVRKAFRAAG